VLISGQDYPIKSNAQIHSFLEEFADLSLLHYWSVPSGKWASEMGGMERWRFWNLQIGRRFVPLFGPHRFQNRYMDALWNSAAAVWQVSRDFPLGMWPYGGSMWWVLTEEAARHVVEFTNDHPAYYRFFRGVKIPDEMYVHSILMNSGLRCRVHNRMTHFVRWSSSRAPSPDLLTLGDFEALSGSDCLFARKFDSTIDARVLDRIDDELLRPRADRTGQAGSRDPALPPAATVVAD
jgi:hypothetical protein